VNQACEEGVAGPGEDSDGIRLESELESLYDEDDEQPSRRSFNPRANLAEFKFKLGMLFPSVESLRCTLREVFIKQHRSFKYVHNDQTRVRARCTGKGCNWTLYAKVQNSDNRTMRINTLLDNYECGLVFDNKLVTSKWLSVEFLEYFRLNPNMDYQNFKELAAAAHYTNVSYPVFTRARTNARHALEGSVRDQYAILEDYCKQILATNPGSTAILKTDLVDDKILFQRVYICLNACKEGFNRGCRPLLGFDGCFLKGYCKGMLLAAVVQFDGLEGHSKRTCSNPGSSQVQFELTCKILYVNLDN